MSDQNHTEQSETADRTSQDTAAPLRFRYVSKGIKAMASLVVLALGLYCLFVGYAYISTPNLIRNPAFQHYHFRLQVLVDGKAVNFASNDFQEVAGHDVCTAQLTRDPVHFHDLNSQMVHIHWAHMTGGLMLKYYGWNYYGGLHGTLGFRFDQFPKLSNVPIHGNALPSVPKGDNFYVFTGDQHNYKERTFHDFVHQDLETFFGKKSNLPTGTTSFLDKLFPKAYADTTLPASPTIQPTDAQLQRLNNLIGNVVIFVQKSHPSTKQVQDRFNQLAPLPMSTCAG